MSTESKKEIEITQDEDFFYLRIKGQGHFLGFGKSVGDAIDYALEHTAHMIKEVSSEQTAILEYKKQAEVKA